MFWQIFVKMSHFGDPTYLENIFHTHHWICLVKALLLSTHMTIFWGMIFWSKKVAKLVETQKFCQNRLNHSFLLKGSYSHFLIWWIIRKLAFSVFFWGFSNGTLKVTPPGKHWKKLSHYGSMIYQKIARNDVSSFSRKYKKNVKNIFFLRWPWVGE